MSEAPVDPDTRPESAPEGPPLATRIMLVTDAWEPQVNGVVRTLSNTMRELQGMGCEIEVVSPADGKLVLIERVEHDEYIGGPAVKFGIFLSIFNVHTNRTPIACRVVKIAYFKGKYLNALKPESAKVNEKLELSIQGTQAPFRPMIVRQIAGAIARRIVCWVRPDEELLSGCLFGMIKFGSRTELVLPDEPGLEIVAKLGDAVQGGSTIMVRYAK